MRENEDLEVSHLRIDSGPPGLGISGDLATQDFGAAWREGQGIVVDCALRPQNAPRLATALARLCGHAVTSMLFGRERRRWEDFLRGAASPRKLPGNLDFAFRVTEARALPGVDAATAVSSDALSDAIHLALDAEAYRALDGLLFDVLGRPDPEPCGWEIETDLRQSLWALWEAWRQVLNADEQVCRRFLVLLAHEQDFEGEADAALVRVGPRTLRAHPLKAAIFALAFVAGSDSQVVPVADRPGNIRGEVLSGHACGVAWIEGREVGPRTVLRPWTTSVVLLAELRAAVEVLGEEPRLDTFGRERPGSAIQPRWTAP